MVSSVLFVSIYNRQPVQPEEGAQGWSCERAELRSQRDLLIPTPLYRSRPFWGVVLVEGISTGFKPGGETEEDSSPKMEGMPWLTILVISQEGFGNSALGSHHYCPSTHEELESTNIPKKPTCDI